MRRVTRNFQPMLVKNGKPPLIHIHSYSGADLLEAQGGQVTRPPNFGIIIRYVRNFAKLICGSISK